MFACSSRKNVRRYTDAPKSDSAWLSCFWCNRALKQAGCPCGRGLRGLSKFSRELWSQVRFFGAARRSRARKNAHNSSKNRASCAAHVMLCCCRRILGACIFKVDKYLDRGEIFCAETERPNRDLIQYWLWRCWLQVHFCSLSDCWRNHSGCSGREQRRRSDFRFDDYVSSHYL